ncbi:MAG TPA: nucleotide pyrophosphohydrolase [Fibrobacteria bacterium]|nr:nucleotide pyrophosphohydrolase [Fibrobacteria bacterium]HOX53668.1 nucleotide pyrophosphohydrolase [Fibrobacteria bacterium]
MPTTKPDSLDLTPRPDDLTLRSIQSITDDWIRTVGVRYFSELTNLAQLTEEVGELARLISRTYGEQSFKESDKHRDLGEEMADVLWVLVCLANQTGVDLTGEFVKRLEKKTARDKTRHLENPKLRV